MEYGERAVLVHSRAQFILADAFPVVAAGTARMETREDDREGHERGCCCPHHAWLLLTN
jgi:hypothetical protein